MECGDSRAANGSNMPLQTQQRTLVAIPHYNYGSRPSQEHIFKILRNNGVSRIDLIFEIYAIVLMVNNYGRHKSSGAVWSNSDWSWQLTVKWSCAEQSSSKQ
uniref:Uncharacterized protein n=1 Tax=Strigamia maritima TaxID=126957 RepID=T1IHF0_STRMM